MLLAKDAKGAAPLSRSPDRAAKPDLVRVRELSETTLLIAVFGEVDATSAPDLTEHIERHLSGYLQLVLDLSRVEFFGTAGYSVLHRLEVLCALAGVEWVVVPGPEVGRLLRVCDPDGVVPTAPNIVSAVAALARSHTRLLG